MLNSSSGAAIYQWLQFLLTKVQVIRFAHVLLHSMLWNIRETSTRLRYCGCKHRSPRHLHQFFALLRSIRQKKNNNPKTTQNPTAHRVTEMLQVYLWPRRLLPYAFDLQPRVRKSWGRYGKCKNEQTKRSRLKIRFTLYYTENTWLDVLLCELNSFVKISSSMKDLSGSGGQNAM